MQGSPAVMQDAATLTLRLQCNHVHTPVGIIQMALVSNNYGCRFPFRIRGVAVGKRSMYCGHGRSLDNMMIVESQFIHTASEQCGQRTVVPCCTPAKHTLTQQELRSGNAVSAVHLFIYQ